MFQKKIDSYSFLTNGIFFLIIGILILTIPKQFFQYLMLFLGYGMIFFGIVNTLLFLVKGSKKANNLIKNLINFIFGLFLINFRSFFLPSLSFFFGLYLLLHAIIHLINYLLYRNSKIKGKLKVLLQFIFTFILSFLLTFHPLKNSGYFELISGIYFCLLGINYLFDFISLFIPKKIYSKMKNHIKIPLPDFLAASIPERLISLINDSLVTDQTSINVSKKGTPDLEVLVHLAKNGSAKFGHVEIAFKGLTYSYGNYDAHSRQLFDSIGDGVLLIADKERYIEYAVTKKERYIVSFGISLNQKQIKNVEKQINKLVSENTIDWYPDLQKAELGEIPMRDFKDMSSEIYQFADGKFKKIIKGKNKRFFVLKNNCVMVAESILQTTGNRILQLNGLICPGAYYEYLNREFLKPNSNVITRKVYTKYDYGK